MLKKQKKYRAVIDDQNKNIVYNLNWKRYLFDFDSHYRDQNLILFTIKTNRDSSQMKFFSKLQTL